MPETTNLPTNEELAEIKNMTGENSMNRQSIPIIKFDGKEGKGYFKTLEEKDEKGKNQYELIGETIEGVIVRVRKRIGTKMDADTDLYSKEFDDYYQPVELINSADGKVMAVGSYSELKEKFPDITLAEVIYIFREDTLHRIIIKGFSLSPLWDYVGNFKNDTVLRWITQFGSVAESTKKGTKEFNFFRMTFKKGKETENWREIWQQLKNVNMALSASGQKKLAAAGIKEAAPGDPPIGNLPMIPDEPPVEDEIATQVDKIPFN